jgi:hypothetical protein
VADGAALVKVKVDGVETDTQVSAEIPDRLRAVDLLAKYGLGTTKELTVDHVTGRLEATYRVLVEELDAETFARIDARLAEVWR